MTEDEVSGSLSLVGVSGGGEGRVVGETRESGGGEGNVVGETRESGGGEGSVVGEIEGSMGVDPRREPDAGGREVPSSEFDSEAEDDTDLGSETSPKRRKLDPPFVLETPDRKLLAEIPVASNGAFVGQTSQVQAFVDQVNATSSCTTPGCTGLLKPTHVNLTGLGGAVDIDYDCTGCLERQLTFSSSALCEASGQNVVRLALQVAFIAAGCSYAQYKKVLAHTLGMPAVSARQFYTTLELMHPHVQNMVDEQCELAKQKMKEKPAAELGSFQNAVTTADGAWLTRGHHSQNFTYQVRDYLTGALLYYQHLCQRGKDKICEDKLYEGTSKFTEGYGTSLVFGRAKEEGMNVTIHWMDKDSSSAKAIGQHYPDTKLMLCGGHAARAHQKALKKIQAKKSFTDDEKKSLRGEYPDVDTAKCHCPHRHKSGCGCISGQFITVARSKFFRALVDAGTEPENFVTRMKILPRHARDEHKWEDGKCDFHSLTVCSCGQCGEGDVKCEGKAYKTRNVLTCPYHSLAYQIECEKRAQQAHDVIHPVLGRGHTNQNEASHNVLIRFRPKHSQITRLHYHVSTNLGLLQSNMTYMNHVRGMGYHWLPDLLQRMGLPLLHGVEAVLKQANVKRFEMLEHSKTEAAKKKKIQWKSQHRGTNQEKRKKWGRSQKVQHSYGDADDEEPFVSTPTRSTRKRGKSCRCGSTSHSRTTHRDCPYNKNKGVSVGGIMPIVAASRDSKVGGEGVDEESDQEGEYDSCMESDDSCMESDDECVLSSSDEDVGTPFSIELCTCVGRAHSRSCPLNPRNKGALPLSSLHSATTEPTPTVGTCSSKTERGSDSPLQIINSAAAGTTSECYVSSPHRLSEHSVGASSSVGSSKEHACDGDESSSQVDSMPVGPPVQTKMCKCGSATHLRTTSKLCPLNPRNRPTEESKGSDSGSDSEDLIIGDTEPGTVGPSGPLPSPEWMSGVHQELEHWSGLSLVTESEPVHVSTCPEIVPHTCDSILGDGNCLFRALSKEVTGTQENHKAVRVAIVNFMEHPDNTEVFGEAFPGEEVEKMRQCGVWGTLREISAAATLFQADILIFTYFGEEERRWQCFSPVFRNHTCTLPANGVKLHLYHTGDHYNRVLPQLGDLTSAGSVPSEPPRCNCGSCGASHKRTCPLNPRNRYTKSGK